MCYVKWYNNNRSFRGPQALACLRTTGAPVWEPLHEKTTLPKFRFTLIPPNLWRRTRVFIFLVRADSGLSWVNPEISCRRPRLPGGIWWYTEPVYLSLCGGLHSDCVPKCTGGIQQRGKTMTCSSSSSCLLSICSILFGGVPVGFILI